MAKAISIDVRDIHSVTDFQRNAKAHISRLRKTKSPMVLTVNGTASIVVQDAETYQEQMDRLEQLEEERRFVVAVNEGLADVEAGRTMSLEQFRTRMEKLKTRSGHAA
ncbi:MAG: type II toxin-antitoxin system prevent-host-death family antitoxin [Acidobacteriaceae bacterium]|nr:type II toxin-antitoxin system prevent-host-death family antitoxin [Acidobacteriaceae bacterium]